MRTMETKKKSDGGAVVFMALMFLCRFLLLGMNELEWILMDTGWMWGRGAVKQWGVDENLIVE